MAELASSSDIAVGADAWYSSRVLGGLGSLILLVSAIARCRR